MKTARALICTEQRKFSLREVSIPELRPQDILIKTLYSGVSIGTEMLLINGRHNWGPFPICTGYQAVGVVEKTGSAVENFKTGDRVYYRGWNAPMTCDGQNITPASGTHSSYAVVDSTNPTHGAGLLPKGIDEATASLFVMPSVGANGLNMADVKTGDDVVVVGAGLIGLGVVGCAALRGANVIALDVDGKRLEVAKELGAHQIINSKKEKLAERMKALCPNGADVVFEASGNHACLNMGMGLCKLYGKFVFQSDFGNDDITFNFRPPHRQRVTAYFPTDDGYYPIRRAVLNLMAAGALQWGKTITHQINAADAPEFYGKLLDKSIPDVLGVVIDWSKI